ncbi:MAG TPA: tetratricopeptide repeat protein, partial [Planctomycetota bacterium]|nr:tetratricopeptide repeat protein [Planctomycetota bacterium]
MMIALALALALQSPEDDERRLKRALEDVKAAKPEPGPAFDAWDARYFDAQWGYGRALFRLAEARGTREGWARVVRYFTDFIWEREDYLAALEARIFIARAHQALEEWGPCFAALKAARHVDTPERRKNVDLVEIATRALALELRYRVPRASEHAAALREADAHLKRFPEARDREAFVRLRLELARLLHAARRPSDAALVLEEIRDRHPGTDAGDAALELLADLLGRHEEAFAERLFEKQHFTAAAVRYGRLPKSARVWLRLGQCYLHLRRFHESAAALEMALALESPDRLDAALALEKVLDHLVRLGTLSLKTRLEAHRGWIRATFDLERTGPRLILKMADALVRDGRYDEAAELYGRVRPGQEGHEEAVHAQGYCFFRMKAYERAVEAFRGYLASPVRTPRSTDTAIDLATWSMLHLGRAEEALAFTETRVPQDTVLAQWRLAHRTDALARLGRFEEARRMLASIDEAAGPSPLVRALERLAAGYEAALKAKPEPKLWGGYARTVVALAEKSFRPLRGEKLLAAADALALEASAESWALAFDLYSQYVASQAPPEAE